MGTKYEHELYLQDFTIQAYKSSSTYNSYGQMSVNKVITKNVSQYWWGYTQQLNFKSMNTGNVVS